MGISLKDTEEAAKKFVADNGFAFANGMDQQVVDDQGRPYYKIARSYEVQATPTTFLITPSGHILGRNRRAFAEAHLKEALQILLDYKGP